MIVIGGATATGKSAIAIKLAQELDGEVISADSAQIYCGMDIGTAKLRPCEMKGIPHHLIDELSPNEPYNVAIFTERAKILIDEITSRNKLPIICGGTGFYINALLYNATFDESTIDLRLREKLHQTPFDELTKKLEIIDPKAAEIYKGNTKRVIRAIEFFETTGKKISEHNEEQKAAHPAYNAKIFILGGDRQKMYERINKRVDDMLEQGLVAEVMRLVTHFSPTLTSMQAIGYKEIVRYIQGSCTLDDAISAIKQGTRRFAKRQITWFKHQLPQGIWVDVDGDFDIALHIRSMI